MIVIKLDEKLYKVITCKFTNKKLVIEPIVRRHFEVYKDMSETKCPHYCEPERTVVFVGSYFCQKECINLIESNLVKRYVVCKYDQKP